MLQSAGHLCRACQADRRPHLARERAGELVHRVFIDACDSLQELDALPLARAGVSWESLFCRRYGSIDVDRASARDSRKCGFGTRIDDIQPPAIERPYPAATNVEVLFVCHRWLIIDYRL